MNVSKKLDTEDLWSSVANGCLILAGSMLEKETAPTMAVVETVERLVSIAIEIDKVNLRWAYQSRYGAAVFRGSPLARPATKN